MNRCPRIVLKEESAVVVWREGDSILARVFIANHDPTQSDFMRRLYARIPAIAQETNEYLAGLAANTKGLN